MDQSELVDHYTALAEMESPDETEDALAVAEMERFENHARLTGLASRVWNTPQLRSMILDHMHRDDILRVLCLDKTSFPDVVRSLYRDFEYKHYQAILDPHILVSRLWVILAHQC